MYNNARDRYYTNINYVILYMYINTRMERMSGNDSIYTCLCKYTTHLTHIMNVYTRYIVGENTLCMELLH